jgi:hypothetical protein
LAPVPSSLRQGPLVPEPTGVQLAVVAPSGDLYTVDVDRGVIGWVADIDSGSNVWSGYADHRFAYLAGERGVVAQPLDGTASTRLCEANDGCDPVSGGPWVTIQNESRTLVRPIVDGAVGEAVELPANAYPAGAMGSTLVIVNFSGIYLWDPSTERAPRQVGYGQVFNVSAHGYAWATCDEHMQCEMRVTTDTGRTTRLSDIDPQLLRYGPLWLSPDARYVVLQDFAASPPELVLYDTVDGASQRSNASTVSGFAWSADSTWLVTTDGTRIVITRAADGVQYPIDLPVVGSVHLLMTLT